MGKYSRYLGIALGLGFFLLALTAFLNSQPESRNKRVYHLLKPYIPYKIEKKMSGLRIRDIRTGEKIEPSNTDFYHVLDNLEKDWGEKHLRLEGTTLYVLDDQNKTLTTIQLQNDKELAYIHNFFGI